MSRITRLNSRNYCKYQKKSRGFGYPRLGCSLLFFAKIVLGHFGHDSAILSATGKKSLQPPDVINAISAEPGWRLMLPAWFVYIINLAGYADTLTE